MPATLTQKSLLMHLLCISLFLIIPTLAFVRPPGEPFFPMSRIFVQDTVANFVLLCFFYINYYLLLPRFFFARRYLPYVAWALLFLGIAFTLPFFVGKLYAGNHMLHSVARPGTPEDFMPVRRDDSLLHFMLLEFRRHLSLFFTAVFFSFLLRTNERLSQLKAEKLEAELSSLKAQIHPHFLFNALNSIYALSVKKDDKAADAIIALSGLMRYAIKDARDNRIPLHREVEYIAHYIELQRARLGSTARLLFSCSGHAGNLYIAPLILITYIENAFKYGVNPDVEDCVVDIKLDITSTGISLHTFNKKVQASAQPDATGIGLQNTSERLQHLYGGRYELRISEDEQSFRVMLTLQLI